MSPTVMAAPIDPLLPALELLRDFGRLRTRRMFGGTYIYCNDLFIATVHDGKLFFKANAGTAGEFIRRGLRQFSYPRNGEIATLQYYEAPAEVFEGRAKMKPWAELALKAATQDAAKKMGNKL